MAGRTACAGGLPGRERPADLRHALSLIEQDRDLDWVGAAGFSAGGYAAAALVGVRLDTDLARLLIEGGIPDPVIPEYPNALESEAGPADGVGAEPVRLEGYAIRSALIGLAFWLSQSRS